MKNMWNKIMAKSTVALMALAAVWTVSCQDSLDGVYPNESKPSIYEYISGNAELTQFKALIDKADFYGVAQAYGTYTCFAPNNDAVLAYLLENYAGKPVDSLTREEADAMVRYHFVADTLATSDFNETRLNAVNMMKQYLQTQTTLDSLDNVIVTVNRTATIVDGNNRMNNGYVHVIDGFLSRPAKTVAQALKELPEEYSIMKQILADIEAKYKLPNSKGIDSVMNGQTIPLSVSCFYNAAVDTAYTSFLAETDEALENAGILNLDSLINRLVENDLQKAYTHSQLLTNWIGYHCLNGRVYLKDIMEASALTTAVPAQVITVTMVQDSIYLNRFKTDRIDEDGIFLARQGDFVDYACKDGVIQTVEKGSEGSSTIQIIERAAYRVYWDFGDQPEIRALAGFRKAGTAVNFGGDDLSMMRWEGTREITYNVYGLPEVEGSYDVKSQYVYGDLLTMRVCSTVLPRLEITTPVLVAGKYNIWLCWRRANPCAFNAIFHHGPADVESEYEDQFMPSNVNLEEYMDDYDGDTDKALANGWKQYNAKAYNSVFCSKKLGTVEVKTTGAHTLIFEATRGSKGDGNYWDMIQYIPMDDDQVWPRIAMNGDLIEKGTPDCQIYPGQCGVNGYPIVPGCPVHDPAAEE